MLLEIDPYKRSAPVIVEAGDGRSERFPHLYAELRVDDVRAYGPDTNGAYHR